jgi:transcriptional regulator with PAS, ATPase and Fis domain
VNNRELVQKIGKALGAGRGPAKQAAPYLEGRDQTIDGLRAMMGPSEAVHKIVSEIATVAGSHFSVVIQGETGTGKELVARAIHKASPRSRMPFVAVDCGAIPETLFESELFGHEKGAFTGAVQARPGKFEMAHRGTLFLDELANMSKGMQVKLLRSIQERSFFRVGGQKPVDVDLRILVATNQDLCSAAAKGAFSRDLFYRLSEFTISIPALRDRKEDMVHLSNRFLQATNVELGKSVQGFSESAIALILAYHWPGNVRQLKSVVRRAVLQSDEVIAPQHLALGDFPISASGLPLIGSDIEWEGQPLKEIVRLHTIDLERRVIAQALRKTGGNKAKAARLLHIDYKTMHTKVKEYGIKIDSEDEDG